MSVDCLASAEGTASQRSLGGCLCCGAEHLYRETTVISPFLAKRAMCKEPELTRIVFCQSCGLRFFDRGLSDTEASRYYQDYRSTAYCFERNREEPFYTRRAHRQIASWLASAPRRAALAAALVANGAPAHFDAVLDFGGGDGTLISELPCFERAVFDLSEAAPIEGIVRVNEGSRGLRPWNLIVCAQTLEHASSPRALVMTMAGLLAPEGWLYLEVPDEMWSNRTLAGSTRDRWLRWLVGRRRILMAADTLSTACRIVLGFLPPFGFIPMREHLQYFTEQALSALVRRSGLQLAGCGRNAVGQIYAVATKVVP